MGTALLLSIAILVARPATAAEIEGVEFADEIQLPGARDQRLRLHGLGLLRYRVIFRGYVAGLYLPDGIAGDRALEDVARRLELSYFWSIRGADFAKVADEFLQDTLPEKTFSKLRDRVDRLHRAYRDVEPDDRYALTYTPGAGTTLQLNDRELVSIPGADFAEAYFGIWLGSRCLDEPLRDALLGGS